MHKIYIYFLTAFVILTFISFGFYGGSYYISDLQGRFFHVQHEMLKPSGIIGHGLGIIGSLAIIIGVFGYMIRKRFRIFSRIGVLKFWLEFHIFLCTLGPVLILYHTTFKFGGIVAISFWSMVAVVISGVIGRFIYIQIPRTVQGRELSLKELSVLKTDFYNNLKYRFNLGDEQIRKFNSWLHENNSFKKSIFLIRIPKRYFFEKKVVKEIKAELLTLVLSKKDLKQIIKAYKKEIILTRRIEWLSSMREFLRYWHILHLPFALVMLVIMVIHVVVAVVFGYKWIF